MTVINALEKSPEWQSTAVIIAYDDSDGWYDHVTSPLINQSATNGRPEHRRSAHVRFFGKRDHNGSGRCGHGHNACTRALWLWPAPAFPGNFAIRKAELRRPHDHGIRVPS